MENHCNECGLRNLCNKPRIRGRGNSENPKLLIIGEFPNANEDQEGIVFTGGPGNLLSEVLGDSEDQVYMTNAVKCCTYSDWPNIERGTRKPSDLEIEWCQPFLFRELDLFDPKDTAIMTLGNSPLTSLIGKHKGFEKEAGKIQYVKINGKQWKLIPNYPLYYILRGKIGSSTDKEFREIIKMAVNHDREEPEDDRVWKILEPEAAIKEIRLVKEAYLDHEIDYVVYDCETSGFLPWRDRIIMYSLFAENVTDKSAAIPIHLQNICHHEDYPYRVYPIEFSLTPKDIVKINAVMGDMLATVPIVGHNLKFDIHFAVAHNLVKFEDVQLYYDTLLMAHVLVGRQLFGALDLKTLCMKLLGVKNWEAPIDKYRSMFRKIEERSYDQIPTCILGEYAARDTYYNWQLFETFMEQLEVGDREEEERERIEREREVDFPDQITTSREGNEI
jgi:uracil-DNA glycosylase family 4